MLNQLLAEPAAADGRAVRWPAWPRSIDERMGALAAAVPQIDPTLEGTVRSTLGRMQHDLQTLHNKVIQAAKRRDETLRRQFQRAQALTFPQAIRRSARSASSGSSTVTARRWSTGCSRTSRSGWATTGS